MTAAENRIGAQRQNVPEQTTARASAAGRFETIQALRAVAALLVVFAHFYGAETEYAGPVTIMAGMPDFVLVAIDLFFLFSGFVLVHAALADPPGARQGVAFLCRRVLRVYPLYWLVMAAFLLLFAGNWLVFGEPVPADNLLADLLLLPTGERTFLVVSWTLVHEIYFYLVFSLILFAPRRYLVHFLVLWGLVILAARLLGWREAGPLADLLFHPMTFDFLAGCFIALLIAGGVRRFGGLALIGGTVWYGALVFARDWFDLAAVAKMAEGWHLFLNYGVPAAFILYGAAACEVTGRLRAPRWLVAIGNRSYTLYLIHIPVMMVSGKLLAPLAGDGVLDNLMFFGIWGILIFVSTDFVYKYAEKPLGRWSERFLDRQFSGLKTPRTEAPTVSQTV